MTTNPPPIYDILVEETGKPKLSWISFFDQMYKGDAGTSWTPTFSGMGTSGTPTYAGKYIRISDYLKYFVITVTPATNTSSTSATTYCDNFPLNVSTDGFCIAVGGSVGVGLGIVQASTNRIYTPAWTNVTVPVTIMGIVEAS